MDFGNSLRGGEGSSSMSRRNFLMGTTAVAAAVVGLIPNAAEANEEIKTSFDTYIEAIKYAKLKKYNIVYTSSNKMVFVSPSTLEAYQQHDAYGVSLAPQGIYFVTSKEGFAPPLINNELIIASIVIKEFEDRFDNDDDGRNNQGDDIVLEPTPDPAPAPDTGTGTGKGEECTGGTIRGPFGGCV